MANSPLQSHQMTWLSALREAQATLDAFLKDPGQIEKCEKFSQILIESFEMCIRDSRLQAHLRTFIYAIERQFQGHVTTW